MLKKQINFINIDPGVPPKLTVPNDPVENAVQHHQHSYRKELLAQIADVIAQNPGIRVHVSRFRKRVETALGEQLNRQRYVPCFRFRLLE